MVEALKTNNSANMHENDGAYRTQYIITVEAYSYEKVRWTVTYEKIVIIPMT
jgi:spore coat polysaccharide biosynthesis protein SpsF (cytidylyltransferase family)